MCKSFRVSIFAALAIVLTQLTPALAVEPAVILIVNVPALMEQSKAGAAARDQISKTAQAIQDDWQSSMDSLREEAKKIDQQRSLVSEQDFAKKVEGFQKAEEEKRAANAARTQALQVASVKARQEILSVLRPIFAEIMEKHGGDIMLDQASIVAGGVDLNVTAEALKMLDERLPKVSTDLANPEPVKAN